MQIPRDTLVAMVDGLTSDARIRRAVRVAPAVAFGKMMVTYYPDGAGDLKKCGCPVTQAGLDLNDLGSEEVRFMFAYDGLMWQRFDREHGVVEVTDAPS